MPKLIHATFVRNEAYCVETMLKSLRPYIKDSYVIIDDRSDDETYNILKDYGCHTRFATFENFAKFRNTLLAWIADKGDWIFGLTPDEIITEDVGELLTPLVEKLDSEQNVDGVRFSRKNWFDLEMTKEKTSVYPDWQLRLVRIDYPRIHYINYVHEVPIGYKQTLVMHKDLHHFGLYWKNLQKRWPETNKFYAALRQRQIEDNRKGINDIWPD